MKDLALLRCKVGNNSERLSGDLKVVGLDAGAVDGASADINPVAGYGVVPGGRSRAGAVQVAESEVRMGGVQGRDLEVAAADDLQELGGGPAVEGVVVDNLPLLELMDEVRAGSDCGGQGGS